MKTPGVEPKRKLRLAIEMMVSCGMTNDQIECVCCLITEAACMEVSHQVKQFCEEKKKEVPTSTNGTRF